MYKVDTPTNSLHSLQEVSFSSLGYTERYHLQEWLAAARLEPELARSEVGR